MGWTVWIETGQSEVVFDVSAHKSGGISGICVVFWTSYRRPERSGIA